MYPYHFVLATYKPWVEFYVVDARRLPSGRALVQLTVLVPRWVAWLVALDMYHTLTESMDQTALHELSSDLGCESPADCDVVFTVLVKPVGEVLP